MCLSSQNPCPLPSPFHPSGLSQCTDFECPVSCIELGLVIYFTYGTIYVSMLFSQITPPLPSPTESKSMFFISVSLLLDCIQGRHYHLSKFHIYVLIYCVGVFLSDLLHSVYQTPVSSTSLELIQRCSFSQLSNILFCICTTTFLFIHLLMDIQVTSMFQLL